MNPGMGYKKPSKEEIKRLDEYTKQSRMRSMNWWKISQMDKPYLPMNREVRWLKVRTNNLNERG